MPRSLNMPTPKAPSLTIVPPVNKGGTGSTDPVSAAAALGLVGTAILGAGGGALKTDSSGKIPSSAVPSSVAIGPTLDGPADVYAGQVCDYTITNYDIGQTYTLGSTAGTISRTGDKIRFTAPASPQTVTLTLNERTLTLNVKAVGPVTPSIVTPVANASNVLTGASITSSAFALSTGSGTHQSSDWQISTDATFTNIVYSSSNNTINKTSLTPAGLSALTKYFVRVRYKDSVYGYSQWSVAVPFTTGNFQTATVEEAKVTASDKATNAMLGFCVDISADGTRVVAGSANSAGVYVFVRSGSSWTQEQKIAVTSYSVAMDSTGTRIAIGTLSGYYIYTRTGTTWAQEASNQSVGGQAGLSIDLDLNADRMVLCGNTGSLVHVYLRTGTTWALEFSVTFTAWEVAMSGDGSRIVAAAANTYNATMTPTARIYVRSGTNWTLEQTISPTTTSTLGDYFGCTVGFDTTGTRLILGAKYNDTASATTDSGCVYVFTRSGSTWAQEAVLVPSNPVASALFGSGADINGAGDVIAVGSCSTGTGNINSLYIFTRSGTTWTQRTKLNPSDGVAGDAAAISVNHNYKPLALARLDTRIIWAAEYNDPSGVTDAGALYIYA